MSKFLWPADLKCGKKIVFLSVRKTETPEKDHFLRITVFVPKAANACDASFQSSCQLGPGEPGKMGLTELQLFSAHSSLVL